MALYSDAQLRQAEEKVNRTATAKKRQVYNNASKFRASWWVFVYIYFLYVGSGSMPRGTVDEATMWIEPKICKPKWVESKQKSESRIKVVRGRRHARRWD